LAPFIPKDHRLWQRHRRELSGRNFYDEPHSTADWWLLSLVLVRLRRGHFLPLSLFNYQFILIAGVLEMAGPKAPNPTDLHVGERVRMYRVKAGISQTDLGRHLGITFQQIQKYEKGINRIGASRLQQISELLSIPVAALFDDLPGAKRIGANNLMNEFVEFLGTTLGQRLVLGFMKIRDKDVRTQLVRLIEGIAEHTPPARKRTKKRSPANRDRQ
jgi:transcriptional regulator with XRE-family HTH domain